MKGALQISRKEVKRQIDGGKVLVNGNKVIIASWELSRGDEITVREESPFPLSPEVTENYFLKVVHEDEELLVVEKEAGIPSEKSPTSLKPSLPEIVYQYLKRAHPQFTHPYVLSLHRLDVPTSGLMVYGKSKKALPLLEDFKKHRIGRRYLALVEGQVKLAEGKVDAPLVKHARAKGKKMEIGSGTEGRRAITHYRVIQRHPHCTLLEVDLETGRTHQVRAHLAWLGHPVVGDTMYGKVVGRNLTSLGLHASELKLIHPVTKKKLHFRSQPSKRFRQLIEKAFEQSIQETKGRKAIRLSSGKEKSRKT